MRLIVISVLLGIYSFFGLHAAEEPIATVVVSDFERTRQRFADSVYQTIWSHDFMAEFRDGVKQQTARDEAKGRPSFLHIFKSLSTARFQFNGMKEEDKPQLLAQFDLGAYADVVWAYLEEQDAEPVPAPPGADAAMLKDEGKKRAARYGNNIVVSNLCDPVQQDVHSSESDISAVMSFSGLMKMVKGLGTLSDEELSFVEGVLPGEQVSWSTQLTSNSLKESLTISLNSPRIPGHVDAAAFKYFPAKTLLAAAFHVNGAYAATKLDGNNLETSEFIIEVNKILTPLGTDCAALLPEVNGTFMIAVTPSIPLPAVTVLLPRSEKVDMLMEAALNKINVKAPVVGSSKLLPLRGMPIMMQVGRNDGYWVFSTDAITLPKILKEEDGGFNQSVLSPVIKKAVDESCYGVLAYDTKSLIQLAMQYSMVIGDDKARANLNDLLMKVQGAVDVSSMTLHWGDKTLEYRGEGLLGGCLNLFPIIAAVIVPVLVDSPSPVSE